MLGGSTELWAQAILAAAVGLLLLISPPRQRLDAFAGVLFALLLLISLTAFLPASWFGAPTWRSELAHLGVEFPKTRSPQPWITLEAVLLLSLGLGWTGYLFSFDWDPPLRKRIWDAFCLGVLALAATLTICFALNKHVPFWPEVNEFGFFPNRNQTGNVLGLGGVMIYANAFQHLQRGRTLGWVWLASLALICWALILNYSRGGIIVFFAGALIWNIWWWLQRAEQPRRALTFAPLCLLVLLLVIAGGETFLRFKQQSADIVAPIESARGLIFRDALALWKETPVLGIGLGNFRALFSSHRRFYLGLSEAIHPENDWLWLGVEAGAVAVLIVLVLFGWWIRRCFPFARGTWRQMRVAALICGCAFAVHGFFDVSGHRMGALWPALFLASSAISAQDRHLHSRSVLVGFRVAGGLLLAVACFWFASLLGQNLPTTVTLHRFALAADRAIDNENYEELLALTNRALRIAPLNWELYFKRGVAEAALHRSRDDVTRDFVVARRLLPNWPEVYLKEGQAWLAVGEPDLAFEIWREGMERLQNDAPRLYEQIGALVRDDPDLLDRWRELGHADKATLLIMLRSIDPIGFRVELDRLLAQDRQLHSFSTEEQKTILNAWYEKGDKLALAEFLRADHEHEKKAWTILARVYADYQDYRQAYETLRRFVSPPQLPNEDKNEPLERARAQFRLNPTFESGFALYFAEMRAQREEDALQTLNVLAALPDPPKNVFWLQSELWARKGNWQQAWKALWEYQNSKR